MKENVLDVLMYLFENYFEDEVTLGMDQESIRASLLQEGFPESSVDRAFSWLEGLAWREGEAPEDLVERRRPSIRLFAPQEQERLDVECRGFLLFLEQVGILNPVNRERVIERVLALDDEVNLEQAKWVVQMVLFNQPDQENEYTWLEELVLDQGVGSLH